MPPLLRWFLRLGPTNPIAVRLVQNGSRRMRHLYIRSGYLAALILVLLWTLLAATGGSGTMGYRELAQNGALSFQMVAFLQIGLICVLAPVFMAGAIAQEANPRTWEVLLTTPLGALEIVLGNLLGRLFFILALLFSSLPLFAITQYFGGVPGSSIFASYAIAGCAALLVGSIAIALSVSRLVGKRAVFAFYVAVVSYVALSWGVDLFLRRGGHGAGTAGTGVTWMTAINPFLALQSLLSPSSYPTAEPSPAHNGFWESWFLQKPVGAWCLGCFVLSLVLVAASTVTVRAGGLSTLMGRESAATVPWYRKVFGLGAKGAEHRPPRAVWSNPIAWREAAARNATLGRMLSRWSFIAIGALWGIGLIAMFHGGSMNASDFQLALLTTVIAEFAVTALVAINMAATAISREREDGTLDLLLTTPITPGNYLSGKLRGLVAYLLPLIAVPAGTLALAGLYVLFGDMSGNKAVMTTVMTSASTKVLTPVVLPESGVVAALVAVPFIAFCAIIGLYWSLKSKGTLSSVVGTVAVAGAVSGVIGLCGWNAGSSVPIIGPILSALSPASMAYALVHPVEAMDKTIEGATLGGARFTLVIGAGVAAAVYAMIVYFIHASMVKGFDMTVRKLAGVR